MSESYRAKLDALEAGTLGADGFSHRDHIGVAWEVLNRDEFFTAASCFADGLRRLTARAGVPEKYNATLTLAYLSLIAERMGDAPDAASFIAAHPELTDPGFVAGLYAGTDLGAPLARRVGLLPQPRQVR